MNWKPIPQWPYEVSDTGSVRNIRTGHILRAQLHKSGYMNVQLWLRGQFWTVGVHQLVMLAHVGPLPSPSHEVLHGDGDSTYNVLSNLRYGLHLENMRDRDTHGGTARNERNGKVKHSDEVVAAARAGYAKGLGPRALGAMLGVSEQTVFGWLKGRTR